MQLNAFRIRLALIGAGALVILIHFILVGSLAPGRNAVIMVEFGMWPDEFEGCQVQIDGEPVGVLKRFGGAFRTGFEVEDGEHLVEIVHPDYRCQPKRVTSGAGGHTVMLIPDFISTSGPDGEETVISFQM